MRLKVLLDKHEFSEAIKKFFTGEEFEVHNLQERALLLDAVEKGHFNIILLFDTYGLGISDIVAKLKVLDPRSEVIFIGQRDEENTAIEAIKNGATAYFDMPVDMNRFEETLRNIKEMVHIRRETGEIERLLHEKYIFAGMVSKDPVMLDIFLLVKRLAPYYRSVLITGETGTGKEMIARALHNLSPWAKEPFVTCNCVALVENLIESELFGHVKGAFTGAVSDKKGLFEVAGSGTIFLDEIGEMPLSFQPHLLRVLQDGEFRRVGSPHIANAKCRVIAATNIPLEERVKAGSFREDLFFRLNVINIKLPPLRERKEDIPLLSRFFLEKFNKKIGKNIIGISRPAQALLMAYDWPGNVRELENVLERAALLTTEDFIRPKDLPAYIGKGETEISATLNLHDFEKKHIQKILLTAGGNKTRAASLLGISRRALQRKIIKYGL